MLPPAWGPFKVWDFLQSFHSGRRGLVERGSTPILFFLNLFWSARV